MSSKAERAKVMQGVRVGVMQGVMQRDDAESDGMTTTIQGKISSRVACLPQVVAMNVVSSFTEHNLYPNKIAMVPSILISKHHFRVCLYHCERDILLLSSEVFAQYQRSLVAKCNGPFMGSVKSQALPCRTAS